MKVLVGLGGALAGGPQVVIGRIIFLAAVELKEAMSRPAGVSLRLLVSIKEFA